MKKHLLAGAAFLLLASTAYAVSLPNGTAVFETSLASRISATDTSMTLVTNSANGETVNGYDCFTLDEGRTDAEYVCGTVSGTSVTGLERGISYANGTTTSPSRAHVHRVGANVKKTDFPLIQRLRNILGGVEGLPGPISYATHPTFTSNTQLVDLQQLNATAFGSVPVIVPSGGTGATSLPQMLLQGNTTGAITGTSTPTVASIFATSTATSSFAGPVNSTFAGASTSTFSGGFQVGGAFTAIGTTTLGASSVTGNALILNGISYRWPASQGASSTSLQTDGAGSLSFGRSAFSVIYNQQTPQTGTVTTTVVIPANTLNTGGKVMMDWQGSATGGSGTAHYKVIIGSGSASTTLQTLTNSDGAGHIFIGPTAGASVSYNAILNNSGTLSNLLTTQAYSPANKIYVAFVTVPTDGSATLYSALVTLVSGQ